MGGETETKSKNLVVVTQHKPKHKTVQVKQQTTTVAVGRLMIGDEAAKQAVAEAEAEAAKKRQRAKRNFYFRRHTHCSSRANGRADKESV